MERTIFADEHLMFRDAFRRFVAQEISPNFLQWEKDGIVPREYHPPCEQTSTNWPPQAADERDKEQTQQGNFRND